MPHATMSQVSPGFRWSLVGGLALAAFLALLLTSGQARAVGERVDVLDPHVMEGESFRFNVSIPSVGEPVGARVSVTCASCGAGWVSQPLTSWRQGVPGVWNRSLEFPSALFGTTSTPEPRFAMNYTVSVVGGGGPFHEANATVHLVDDWLQPNSTYSTGGVVRIRTAGVQGQYAYINISKWAESGARVRVANLTIPAPGGKAAADWSIPREHASDMTCPHIQGRCQDYLVEVVGGAGKSETVQVRAKPGELATRVSYIATEPPEPEALPLPGPPSYNRTETVRILVEARYVNNAPLRPEDLTKPGDARLNGSLKLVVEKIVAPAVGNGTVAETTWTLWAHHTPRGWRANWTIPKNLSTTVQGAEEPLYRVRAPLQEDRWGNRVPSTNGTAFAATPLHIKPEVIVAPRSEVERLGNASALFRMRYADGSLWTNGTGQENVTASLVGPTGDVYSSAKVAYRGNGTWAAWYLPKLGFKDLGSYRLRIDPNRDEAENFLDANDTAAFEIVPAKPRVELHTFVGLGERNETQGFARGDKVLVSAKITYPDGSAYNRSRLPSTWANLTVNVTKVDAGGLERGATSFRLEALDDALGLWEGDFFVRGADADLPLGPWRWSLEVRDREQPAPNANTSLFTRWVHGAGLDVHVVAQPEPLVRAGEMVTLRFAAQYPNGTVLTDGLAAGGILVHVAPWKDGRAHAPVARPFPQYNASRGDWSVQWATNRTTIVGEYVVQIEGLDVLGNVLEPTTTRPTRVFVEQLLRPVLVQPPPEVRRGEEVIVIFDGAEGDLGLEGEPAPRIELQKWNPLRKAWEVEKLNVRNASDPNMTDHVGRLVTSETTNLGEYRFVLQARDLQHALVDAQSATFRVLPVELSRAWIGPGAGAVLNITKGGQLELQLERQTGDTLVNAAVYRDGQRVVNISTLSRVGRFDLSWTAAYTLPDGAYAVVLKGRDIHNNTFASPPKPFNLTGVELRAKLPGAPDAALPRASRLDLRIQLQYPDLQPVRQGNFTARFLLDGAAIAERPLEHNHSVWFGNWTPPAGAPLGAYRVVVDGHDGRGNWLRNASLFDLQLGEGVVERSFTLQRNLANRTETVTWVLPADATDTGMRFTLRDDAGNRRPMNATLTSKGAYEVKWKPGAGERLGRYVLEAQGSDQAGNAVTAQSRSMLLAPAQVGTKFLLAPEVVKPGEAGRWEFVLVFRDGTALPVDEANRPLIMMTQSRKEVQPKPTLAIEGGRWVATWTPVAGEHSGSYYLTTGGNDALGNLIQTNEELVKIEEGLLKQVLGVPGFEAFLLPVALLGAALVRRWRSPRP